MLKGPEEVFLEAKVGQFSFLQELHGKLPQGIHSKDGDVFIGIAAHLERNNVVQDNCLKIFITSIELEQQRKQP